MEGKQSTTVNLLLSSTTFDISKMCYFINNQCRACHKKIGSSNGLGVGLFFIVTVCDREGKERLQVRVTIP